ncbi:MAG: 30S ribosomal protein S6 [Candidatus Liptonbacteria bacterium]|nr:30S ribosomal protein S6 [Candidatus Liptonbacteria bacterium]
MEEENVKKEYELAFLTRGEEHVLGVIAMLKKGGAEITSQGTLVRQRLAYPIKKETQAVLGSLNFRLDPEAIAGLDHELRFDPHVLRFLMVTPPIAKPQGIMYERRMAPASKPEGLSAGRQDGQARPRPAEPKKAEPAPAAALSNEALEKRLEEILQ